MELSFKNDRIDYVDKRLLAKWILSKAKVILKEEILEFRKVTIKSNI